MKWIKKPIEVTPEVDCVLHVCWDRQCDDGTCGVRACVTKSCPYDY